MSLAAKGAIDLTIHSSPAAATDAEFVAGLLRRQPEGFSLHQGLYNSPEAFRHDLERIFGRHWFLAGHAGSAPAPGDYYLADIGTESIIIVRGQDGVLRAFANVCRHRGSHVCTKPEGHASVLVCPYHAWAYNLDGTLRSARYMGPDFDKSLYGLKPVHIEVAEGLVFISLADKPLNFEPARKAIKAAHGPYGWADAKVAHRQTYEIEANWKLAVENYLECYHCTPSHPEYSKLHALEKPPEQIEVMNAAMEARTCAMGVNVAATDHCVASASGDAAIFCFRYALYDGVKSGGPSGEALAPLMGEFPDYDGGVTSTHQWPASFFVAYNDNGVLYRFIPRTASTCAMEIVWLVQGDAKAGVDYNLDKLTWLWQVTSEADKRITQDNQKGVNSRYYQPGPYAPMEANLKAWAKWYLGEIG